MNDEYYLVGRIQDLENEVKMLQEIKSKYPQQAAIAIAKKEKEGK